MPVPRNPDPLPAPRLRGHEAERRLRDAIVRGALAPGERVTEEDLAAWLGVSRTPIREALGRLAATGLVVLDASRGARVTPLEPQRMLDLVQVSRELVVLAQRLAAERATEVEVAALRRFHGERVAALRAGDSDAVERGALAFHSTILAASRNMELQRVYPMVFHRLERVFRLAFPQWLQEAGLAVDGAILAAIEAHDPGAAAVASGRGWDVLEADIRARIAAAAARGRPPAAGGTAPGHGRDPAATGQDASELSRASRR